MNKRVTTKEKITQVCIGLRTRQFEFFENHPEFRLQDFVRNAVDEQIRLIDDKFLGVDND